MSTEIRVPVTAPGSNQAAGEIRGVAAAAREAAEAEDRHIAKLRESAAKMEQLAQWERKVAMDRKRSAEERIAAQQREVEASRLAMREQNQAVQRMQQADQEQFRRIRGGGEGGSGDGGGGSSPFRTVARGIGGAFGRYAGLAAGGGLAGGIGLAGAAVHQVEQLLTDAMRREAEQIRAGNTIRAEYYKAIKDAGTSLGQAGDAYYASQGKAERRLAGRGFDSSQVGAFASRGMINAAGGLAELGHTRDAGDRERQTRAAEIVARTEGIGLDEAARAVRKFPMTGDANADAARAINSLRGLRGGDQLSGDEVNQEHHRIRLSSFSDTDKRFARLQTAQRGQMGRAGEAAGKEADALEDPYKSADEGFEAAKTKHAKALEELALSETLVAGGLKELARLLTLGAHGGSAYRDVGAAR